MGFLRKRRRRRRSARAEIGAAKRRASKEIAARAKSRDRQGKLLARQEKELLKAERKGLNARRKHERAMAKNKLAQLRAGKINRANVQRWLGVARLLSPLLIPLAYRGITAGQERLNVFRAQRYGVTAEQLAQFSGHGAPLKARIAGLRDTLKTAHLPAGFIHDVQDRLDELDGAIANSEYMTPEQRRRAHASISRDIDEVTHQVREKIG